MPTTQRTQKVRRIGAPSHALDVPRLILYREDQKLADWLREQSRQNERSLGGQIRFILRQVMEASSHA